jgi:hypothetical protein
MKPSAEERARALVPAGEVQVEAKHYDFESYDDPRRWMSYWYQIRAALALRPRRVLEIGSGSGVFRSYLTNVGVDVRSVDIDDSRRPDWVGSVTELDQVVPASEKFDIVAAFQVLEHLPFDEFPRCLEQLARLAPHVLLSLPCHGFELRLGFALAGLKSSRGIYVPYPWRFRRSEFPEHHWELGVGYSVRKITRILQDRFDVVDRHHVAENPYHYMWVLKRRS